MCVYDCALAIKNGKKGDFHLKIRAFQIKNTD